MARRGTKYMDSDTELRVCSRVYWRQATTCFHDSRMLVFAALIVALRVVVKLFKITLAPGLSLTFDCYVNALGSMVYGPVVGLLVGAVSDTLGYILFPSGAYFLPFILTEMGSSLIFGLFLWRKKIDIGRVVLSKFTVNFVCNIIMTSVFCKWSYYVFYGIEKAETYNIINMVRIAKNLVLFPVEALLITMVLRAAARPLAALGIRSFSFSVEKLKRKHYLIIAGYAVLSVGLVLAYIFWGMDFVKAHNIKLL